MASAYGLRPSALLEIGDSWAAYQLDLAALLVGSHIEAATADGKKRVAQVLGEMERRAQPAVRPSSSPPGPASGPDPRASRSERGEFRSLAGMASRRVKVKPDGTW